MSDSYLGPRTAVGRLNAGNPYVAGAWTITFDPEMLPVDAACEAWHGAVRGPGGSFLVYIDDQHYGSADNGRINEYAPTGGAMYIRRGQSIHLHWSIATGTAPTATLYFRRPEVGRI